MHAPIISPSILAADFSKLGDEVRAVANGDWIHVDIMDGHFVPNLSFGPDITKTVDKVTDQVLDVHLMIENPEKWVENYRDAGADCIIFHVEAVADEQAAIDLAEKIRGMGVRAGFSIKPGTPIEPWLDKLKHFDLALVMSVEPGFGGQKFMPDMLDKVRALRKAIDEQGLDTLIEIDGGISASTIEESAAAGCDAFVAGSAVFGKDDKAAAVEELRTLATKALAH
ncbi:Ribulose-phosphate 3-epimerase [Corynebacterium camporealensis]|uniref:Ribulose-phosphate 3-epimerase n=1 Tax=Corynebacterium camporealensis TaxID=161896 RepID=A0A0F6QW54_9CORY|nr:ribulose-phosphate 3-epimerase [Corynebacterium camporealensis]AKE39232.1 ribulose-phosphate 3-epimerase [Corynebacterium camporealensis]AVH88424.1 Ribulose-phosphate 3-epimerase [Corynebacterium camporealensis]MDY5839955.1 ribulose-phosphate 3-epimerase [Corynebacterium camporealensis]